MSNTETVQVNITLSLPKDHWETMQMYIIRDGDDPGACLEEAALQGFGRLFTGRVPADVRNFIAMKNGELPDKKGKAGKRKPGLKSTKKPEQE